MSGDTDGPLETLTGVVAVATLPAAALAAIFVGATAAGVVAIVGWLLLVPVLGVLSDYYDPGTGTASDPATETVRGESDADGDDALQRLRERYAAGEIDDVEFERRLERLLETEGVEVPDHVDLNRTSGAGVDVRADRGPERARERERESE